MSEPIQEELDFETEFLGTTALQETDSYGITVDDNNNVLEFIKVDTTGTYVRSSGKWEALDPDADEDDNSTVFNKSWYDVTETFMLYYDHYVLKRDKLSLDEITNFLVL